MSSPSRQEVVTQLTEGVVVTRSSRGHHTVDQWGCRHQVSKKGMLSPSRQEVVTQSPEGAGTPSQPRSRDTKSTQERVHQVNPRGGDSKSTGERGHQVNRRAEGDTKSTHGEREGTPSQPTEKGRGHHVNLWKRCRAYQLID